jgi:capsule polysaccharide export protein KpsE/RkpR
VGNTPLVSPSLTPQPPTSQGSSANPQIQALDQQIHTLRDQFKSQSEPLEAQLKALHDQFDPQLKSLEVALARLRRQGAYAA